MSKQTIPFIVQDTREQKPYSFPAGWPVIQKALPSGDYSCLGHENVIAIERKSLNDLTGCIFQKRFKAELERLREYKHAFLVVESSIYTIENRLAQACPRTKASPKSIVGFLQAIPLLYGVQVLYLDNRQTAERYVAGLLEKYNRFLLNDNANDASVTNEANGGEKIK